jgi:hypothetical protein
MAAECGKAKMEIHIVGTGSRDDHKGMVFISGLMEIATKACGTNL